MSKHVIRGGNSAFAKNGVIHTTDDGGCPRTILLRAQGIEKPHSELSYKVFAVGAYNEDYRETQLVAQGHTFTKELALQESVTDDTDLFGHSDYVVVHEDGSVVVEELKCVVSKNTYRDVFTKNTPKIQNVAQCVQYMIMRETPTGSLIYTSYLEAFEYKDMAFMSTGEILDAIRVITPTQRFFSIVISVKGDIIIDDTRTQFNVSDVFEHRRIAANALEKLEVYPHRPNNWNTPFKSPCHFCNWKPVCDRIDTGEKLDFIKESTKLLKE